MTEIAHQQHVAKEEDRALAIKSILMRELTTAGITRVDIDYNGEGDEGQIDGITMRAGDKLFDDLEGSQSLQICVDGKLETFTSWHQCIDELVWLILCEYHDGYEINDGGFGTVTIDVTNDLITIDHNDRVIDFVCTETEI
jgi:hypothetical protein